MDFTNISDVLKFMLITSAQMAIYAPVIIGFILNIKTLKQNYRTGLVIGIIIFALTLPVLIFVMANFGTMPFMVKHDTPPDSDSFFKYFIYVGFIMGIGFQALAIGWYMVVYHAAVTEWDKIKPNVFPIIRERGAFPWRGILSAVLFGIAAGVVSGYVFSYLGVKESESLKVFSMPPEKFNGLGGLIILLLAVIVPAITEELAYRGGALGLLLRLSQNNRVYAAGSIVLVSALWAVAHFYNTGDPAIKCLQIFLIGLVLAEFARRSSLESAIVVHISLNVTAVIMYFAIGKL